MSRSTQKMTTYPKLPIPQGPMHLTQPEDDYCHPVVGSKYNEARRRQISRVNKILNGGGGSSSRLPNTSMLGSVDRLKIHEPPNTAQTAGLEYTLEEILRVIPVGREVIAYLWTEDTPAVGSLASTSKGCSDAVAIYVSRFHLPLGDYQDCDFPPSVVAEMPQNRQQTIGIGKHLFVRGRDSHVSHRTIKGIPGCWTDPKICCQIWEIAQEKKHDSGIYLKLLPFIVRYVKLFALEDVLNQKRELRGLPPIDRSNEYRNLLEMNYNIPMLTSLHQWGTNLRAIRFQEVPMMDLRIVELVISTCPSLEVLGLVNCEMLHFSHVIHLLDLLNWDSKKKSRKPVKLDFFPRTYFGPEVNRKGTYVLSWESLPMDPNNTRIAVLATVLLAVLKALPLGIDLVSKDQSFRKFIDLVPMKPGATAIFLHHIFNWIDAKKEDAKTLTFPSNIQDNLEDQVLLSLLQGSKHNLQYHKRHEYFDKFDCCICGHAMIKPLFRPDMDCRLDHQRVCRPCNLYHALESERHHNLEKKYLLINETLYSAEDVPHHPRKDETDLDARKTDLENVVAPLLRNPFMIPPKSDSPHRIRKLDEHRALPAIEHLIDTGRNYDLLRASGDATIIDVADKLKELQGIYEDHPTLTTQRQPPLAKHYKQSWEYAMEKDSAGDTSGGFGKAWDVEFW